ncbi:MAG: nitroreductase family protein, partial [Lutispora sp.]
MKEIYTRRSIRKYEDKPVTDEQIHELLRAAMYAPSAGNEKPWHFVVIKDRAILNEITTYHPHTQMLK